MLLARLTVVAAIAGLAPLTASAETFRISCENFDGNRVQYAGNAGSPPSHLRRLVKADDAITGIKVEITFSNVEQTAKVTSFGNANVGGRVTGMDLVKVESAGKVSLWVSTAKTAQ